MLSGGAAGSGGKLTPREQAYGVALELTREPPTDAVWLVCGVALGLMLAYLLWLAWLGRIAGKGAGKLGQAIAERAG